jgi:hypothetical protein
MNVLEKDNNKENKMVLVYVYKLLKYHKKAYDLYIEIYNENGRLIFILNIENRKDA